MANRKQLTGNINCKMCWWYRVLIYIFKLLVFTRVMSSGTATKKLSRLTDRGLKVKIGSGKWECLRRESCKRNW